VRVNVPQIKALVVEGQLTAQDIQKKMGEPADRPLDSVLAPDRKEKRLAERFSEAIRARHYSRRTGKSYWYWIRYFIFFHGKRHPSEMGAEEVSAFLSWLAVQRDVAATTQNQALAALLFLYKQVLGRELGWFDDLVRAKRPVRLPVVLTRGEVTALLGQLKAAHWLMASVLYGAGLRLMECLRLRVKDIDIAYRQILVRDGRVARTA